MSDFCHSKIELKNPNFVAIFDNYLQNWVIFDKYPKDVLVFECAIW